LVPFVPLSHYFKERDLGKVDYIEKVGAIIFDQSDWHYSTFKI
jgi:hypothetical protein